MSIGAVVLITLFILIVALHWRAIQANRRCPNCEIPCDRIYLPGYRLPRWKCPQCGTVRRQKTIC